MVHAPFIFAIIGHFIRVIFSGVFLLIGFHAIRRLFFVGNFQTLFTFALKVKNLLSFMELF
ncbi:hypothetical protein DW020_15760 [Clostridium sp. AF37-5AT]|nr:hypothetical protein DW020_15760 [Clostridium sp. AF37-5AT]